MKIESLREAISEAERFLKRAKELEKSDKKIRIQKTDRKNEFNPDWIMNLSTVEMAAVRRASMDLTRALAKLRKWS